MGIRSLLVPFAYAIAVVLKKTKISISSIVLFSFLVIFFTIFSFHMVFASSFYSNWFEIITIAGIFLTGFLDEIIRELRRLKKLPSLPLALARHSDLLIVFGILYILMEQPYAVFTSLNVSESAYPAIGILMFFGVLASDFVARKIEKRDPGLESRAERMFLLTAFLLVGFYFNEFLLAIFVGIIGITVSLYARIFWTKFNFLDIAGRLYSGLLRLWRRAQTGVPNVNFQKAKIPAPGKIEKEESFQEYEVEEYPSTPGHNFTAVVNDRMSEPMSNVKVLLLNVDSDEDYTGYTDQSGRASFVGVTEGQYKVTLECEGYKKSEFERYISMDSGEVFVLKRPFSDLSIVISDKNKTTPVPNAEVFLKPSGNNTSAIKRKADNLGVAYFDELDVGTYEIHVKAKGYDDWKRSINLDEENVISVTLEQGEAIAEEVKTKAEVPEHKEEIEALLEEVSLPEILNGSVLLEYSSPEDVRSAVLQMAIEYKKHDRDVFLVSTPQRTEEYKKELEAEIIDFDPSKPDLAQFERVREGMPAGSALIFEALSNLILTIGFEPAFNFVSNTLKYMEKEGLLLVCFLNPSAHDKKEVEKLRKLLNSVTIEGDKIFK